MAKDDVTVGIGVDSTSAIKGLKDFGKSSKSIVKSISDSVFSLKGAFVGVGAALTAGALANGLKAVTSLASRQEDAVNSLNTALKLSGEFSEGASKGLQDYASGLQKVTKFGDEVILEQLALAKAFGASNDQAKDLVTAATELSAATGKSLEESTRNLAKTLGGLAGELGEVNPKIKALTQEQLKAGEAARILIEQYGGSAASQINTFSGAIEQSQNAFGDLLESLGETIIKNPAVVKAIKELTKGFEFLIEQVELNKKAIGEVVTAIVDNLVKAFGLAGDAVKGTISFFKEYQKVITGLPRLIIQTAVAIGTFNAAIALFSATKAIGALASLKDFGAGMALLAGQAKTSAAAMAIVAGKALLVGVAVTAAAAAVDLLVRNFELVLPAAKQAFNLSEITSLKKEIQDTEKALKSVVETGTGGVPTNSFLGFKTVTNATELTKKLEEMKAELVELTGETEKTGKKLREEFDSGFFGDLIDKFTEFKDKIEEPIKVDIEYKFVGPPAPEGLGKPLEFAGPAAPAGLKEANAKAEKDRIAALKAAGLTIANAIVSGVKQGAEGAKGAITATAGAITDLFFPGFGGLVANFLDLLAEGDGLKNLIDSFVGEIPRVLVAIADGIPALIEGIIDNLDELIIGIVKAAPAFVKAIVKALIIFADPAIWIDVAKSLVQALAQEITGTELVFSKAKTKDIGDGIASDFKKGTANFSIPAILSGGDQFGQSISRNLDGVGERLNQGLIAVFDLFTITFAESLREGFLSLPERFAEGGQIFADIVTNLFGGLFSNLQIFLGSFGTIFKQILGSLGTDIASGFATGTQDFVSGIRNAFINVINLFIKHVVDPILSLPQRINDVFNGIIERMRNAVQVGGRTGGALGQVAGRVTGALGMASGGTIPSGFSNDNFPANLSSGELVVPRNDVQELRTFLREQKRSGGNLDMSETNSLLAKIAGQGGQGGGMITLNEDGLTELLLDFSRRNERISA